MTPVNLVFCGHTGDLLIQAIVLKAALSGNHQNYKLFVPPDLVDNASQIIQLLELNFNIYPSLIYNDDYYLMSPLPIPFYQYKFLLSKPHTSKIIAFQSPICRPNPHNVRTAFRHLFFLLLRPFRFYLYHSIDPHYFDNTQGLIVNNRLQPHILDILINSYSQFLQINQDNLRHNVIQLYSDFHNNYQLKEKLYPVNLFPSTSGKGFIARKSFSESEIETLKRRYSPDLYTSLFSSLRQPDASRTLAYSNLDSLVFLISSSSFSIYPDSFPAHLSVLLGAKGQVFIPGWDFGLFFPYPNWLLSSFNYLPEFVFSFRYSSCFGCRGKCSYDYSCTDWTSLI